MMDELQRTPDNYVYAAHLTEQLRGCYNNNSADTTREMLAALRQGFHEDGYEEKPFLTPEVEHMIDQGAFGSTTRAVYYRVLEICEVSLSPGQVAFLNNNRKLLY